jgi:hypothetical protein
MAMVVILFGVPKDVAGVPKTVPSAPKKVARAGPFPTLYDDFHGTQIDPDRWARSVANGYEMSQGLDPTVGRLMMSVQAYGDVGAPGPSFFQGRVHLFMTNAKAASTIGIQVTAKVEDVNVTGCGSAEPSASQARIHALFFRDGPTPPNPNDETGVVYAVNRITALADLPPGTLRVNFFAFRCLDANCDTDAGLGGGVFQNATLGQDVTLGMELDAANNRIIFTKDAETQFINNVSANQINTNLGPLHRKGIRVVHRLEICPERAEGFIAASFENFRVKP